MTVVDARGLRCPLPVLRLARAARGREAGSTVTLLATDPAAAPDVRAWARLRGHDVVAIDPQRGPAPDVPAAGSTAGDGTAASSTAHDTGPSWRIVVRIRG